MGPEVKMSAVARAFWASRAQDANSGVAAIVATLRGLGELDTEHYGRWFEPGDSEQDALSRPVAVDPRDICAPTRP